MLAFKTFALSLANRWAHARPIPDEPVVMTTTLFANLIEVYKPYPKLADAQRPCRPSPC